MPLLNKPVKTNNFIRRHTQNSHFSHSRLDWDELIQLIESVGQVSKGYRDGVLEVSLPVSDADGPLFYTPIVVLEEGAKLAGEYVARVPGETPRKSIWCIDGEKTPAKYCKVILYSSDVLKPDHQNDHEDAWEMITIIAGIDAMEPMDPDTLMHNHFGSDGGTDTEMSDEDFLKQLKFSFEYWKNKAKFGGAQ